MSRPPILELLADGLPRTKPAIVEALAGRHGKQDVMHALIRLAVTGQVEETNGKYTLASGAGRGLSAEGCSSCPPRGLALIGAVLALAGLALAVTGTGSPMFARRAALRARRPREAGRAGRGRRRRGRRRGRPGDRLSPSRRGRYCSGGMVRAGGMAASTAALTTPQ